MNSISLYTRRLYATETGAAGRIWILNNGLKKVILKKHWEEKPLRTARRIRNNGSKATLCGVLSFRFSGDMLGSITESEGGGTADGAEEVGSLEKGRGGEGARGEGLVRGSWVGGGARGGSDHVDEPPPRIGLEVVNRVRLGWEKRQLHLTAK